jgi:hypothetical protein
MSSHTRRHKYPYITVRGRKISDSILKGEHKYYMLVDSEFYDWSEAYYLLELKGKDNHSNPQYKIIFGIRI